MSSCAASVYFRNRTTSTHWLEPTIVRPIWLVSILLAFRMESAPESEPPELSLGSHLCSRAGSGAQSFAFASKREFRTRVSMQSATPFLSRSPQPPTPVMPPVPLPPAPPVPAPPSIAPLPPLPALFAPLPPALDAPPSAAPALPVSALASALACPPV